MNKFLFYCIASLLSFSFLEGGVSWSVGVRNQGIHIGVGNQGRYTPYPYHSPYHSRGVYRFAPYYRPFPYSPYSGYPTQRRWSTFPRYHWHERPRYVRNYYRCDERGNCRKVYMYYRSRR